MDKNKSNKRHKYNGGISHHVRDIYLLLSHEHAMKKLTSTIYRKVNDNKGVSKILDKKIIYNFKGFFEEFKMGSKPFINIAYFRKWDKCKEIIEPLLIKVRELEKLKKELLCPQTKVLKEEWVEKWTKFFVELSEWFIKYYEKNYELIYEYEKGFVDYRNDCIEVMTTQIKIGK